MIPNPSVHLFNYGIPEHFYEASSFKQSQNPGEQKHCQSRLALKIRSRAREWKTSFHLFWLLHNWNWTLTLVSLHQVSKLQTSLENTAETDSNPDSQVEGFWISVKFYHNSASNARSKVTGPTVPMSLRKWVLSVCSTGYSRARRKSPCSAPKAQESLCTRDKLAKEGIRCALLPDEEGSPCPPLPPSPAAMQRDLLSSNSEEQFCWGERGGGERHLKSPKLTLCMYSIISVNAYWCHLHYWPRQWKGLWGGNKISRAQPCPWERENGITEIKQKPQELYNQVHKKELPFVLWDDSS